MFLSIVILASINRGEIFIEHPDIGVKESAVFGKPSTPTPVGVYLIEKYYSRQLRQNILVFRQDDSGVYAIHANLPSRNGALGNPNPAARRLSAGCIGVSQKTFDKLWGAKGQLVLQVY